MQFSRIRVFCFIGVGCLVLSSMISFSQTPSDPSLELIRLSKESIVRFEIQSKRAKEYAERNNVPLRFRDSNGNLVLLVDVDETGIPIYKSTHNEGAAITTGVNTLQSGGDLGLNLEGEGMVVGVWDGGLVSHSEFGDRILSAQGSPDDHPIHVTGTILASGISPSAKGMAPKASAYTFDFNDDETEMLTLSKPDQTSLLLSNHSYGLISGWNFNGSWQWFGSPAISENEDYKFGYYSGNAAFWDQIAFNAPYYTIVKSAGNDRNNTGNGTRPPDCNGGAGYDCISDVSTSKNIITVGAINKVLSYTDASSVSMSSFSSWGPTDDGRVKPDLVAAGVNLLSTITNDSYGALSGTSMSAPNATGSLLLLQELHKNLHAGNFMRASTLKALAIHSTKETGLYPGPDYKYGWGLLDVHAAAKILLAEDGVNVMVDEYTLLQNQTFELELTPKANEKITATIVWTDPAGMPVTASLDPTNIMLVNDLDIRIIDDANNTQFPWILDPLDPDAAPTRGDNIRDNVEKIEFANPEPRSYRLVVSHKGSLFGGSQNFSLILQYTSLNDSRTAYYWVGDSGNWTDPSKWSLTSGGNPANTIPGSNDRIFIDENSFNSPNQTINISGDVTCGSLTWLTNDIGSISLNGNILEIGGNLTITSPLFSFSTPGMVKLIGSASGSNTVSLAQSDLSEATLLFEEGNWTIGDDGKVGGINLVSGSLIMKDLNLELDSFISEGSIQRSIDIRNSTLDGITESRLQGSNFTLLSSDGTINLSAIDPSIVTWDGLSFEGELVLNGQSLQLNGSSNYFNILVNGEIEFSNNNSISQLTVIQGSSLKLTPGKKLTLSQNVVLNSQAGNEISITTMGIGASALLFDDYYKLCFDNLIIDEVNIEGPAVINAGENSQVTNANDWLEQACDDVLFPKFSSDFSCVGSLISFIDETSGIVESWSWDFGDPTSIDNTSTKQNPYHVYSTIGQYEVTLTVSNANDTRTYSKVVEIGENTMLSNHVVISVDDLFSFRAASAYQWFVDDEPIPGAVSRSFNFNFDAGNYFVLTIEGDCNIKSSPVVITSVEENNFSSLVQIFPNPARDRITIITPHEFLYSDVTILNSMGTRVLNESISQNRQDLFLKDLAAGLYFLRIDTGRHSITRKVVIEE